MKTIRKEENDRKGVSSMKLKIEVSDQKLRECGFTYDRMFKQYARMGKDGALSYTVIKDDGEIVQLVSTPNFLRT